MLIAVLVYIEDGELITDIVDQYACCQPFGSSFRVFQWCYDLSNQRRRDRLARQGIDRNQNNCSRFYCLYTFIYVIKEILKQIAAMIIHLCCCFIFSLFIGFSLSITSAIYKIIDEYPMKSSVCVNWSDTEGRRQVQEFLFNNTLKKRFKSIYGSNYLKNFTKNKDLIIKICCLHYCFTNGLANAGKSKSSMFDKYLIEKYEYCFAGVTMKSLKNNSIIDDKYKNDDKDKNTQTNVSISILFNTLLESFDINDDDVKQRAAFVGFVSLWYVARLCFALMPFIFYVPCINGKYNQPEFWLQTGLFVWYFLAHCCWIGALINYIYQFYCYIQYIKLVPYNRKVIYMRPKQVKQEYTRVLTSFMVKKVLSEYFDRDVCSLIVLYHDNIEIH